MSADTTLTIYGAGHLAGNTVACVIAGVYMGTYTVAANGSIVVTYGSDSSGKVTAAYLVTNFGTGNGHSFGGEYRELMPSEKIVYTDKFDDPNLPGEMMTTVILKQVLCGTELSVVQEGIPAAIPVEMCYLGWQESLAQLAKLVEPEIPG